MACFKRGTRWVLDPQSLGYGFGVAGRSLDFVGHEKGIDHKIVPGAGVLPPEGWIVN
jgi:hypothetical protein